jgi:hypothetical protein
MVSYPPLSLRFIRDTNVPRQDDVLRIVPFGTTGRLFDVQYIDTEERVKHHLVASADEVLDFVEDMIELLPVDQEPFVHVQLLAPSFPSVLIKPQDLERVYVREALLRVFRNTLRNFPIQTTNYRVVKSDTGIYASTTSSTA